MPWGRSPETAALEALLALVRQRYGADYRLAAVRYEIEGPDGLRQAVRLDPTAWLASRASGAAEARHSQDFRSVHWFGADYVFSALQAAVVRQLWEAREAGTPDVSGETLMLTAGSETREIRNAFREHPAWGTMIVSLRRGVYRLAEPGDSPPG